MKSIPVKVVSAVKLSKPQLNKVEKAVQAKYKDAKIDLDTEIDPELIGGVKLIINAVEYDATVQGKLDRLRSHLKGKL